MARVQTVVQLDDRLLDLMDRQAAREGVSRSHLIRQAVAAYLAVEDEAEISRRIIEGYTRIPQDAPDEWGDPGQYSEQLLRQNLEALADEEKAAGKESW